MTIHMQFQQRLTSNLCSSEAKSRETDQLRRQFNAATEEINSLKSQIADRS